MIKVDARQTMTIVAVIKLMMAFLVNTLLGKNLFCEEVLLVDVLSLSSMSLSQHDTRDNSGRNKFCSFSS